MTRKTSVIGGSKETVSKKFLFMMASVFGLAMANAPKSKELFVEEGHNTHPILKDRVSGHRYRKVYIKGVIHPEKNAARRQKHLDRLATYEKLGITWTPFGLYWNTHQLAVEHSC